MLHRIIGFTLLQFFIVSVSSYVNQRNSFAVECPELLFSSVFTYEYRRIQALFDLNEGTLN